MLPSTYPNCDYSFVVVSGSPRRLVFTSAALTEQAQAQPTEPLWFIEVGDERSMRGLVRWVRQRRAQWENWGNLAENSGRPALANLLHGLLNEDPPTEVVGIAIQKGEEDDHELGLGELTQGAEGLAQRIYYRHRFQSAALQSAFHGWLMANNPEANGGALLEVALNHGTDQLGQKMDEIASDELRKEAA